VPIPTLPKSIVAGEAMSTAGARPVPDSGIECGDPAALSPTARRPLATPVVVGVNDTCWVQLPPGARVAPHVLTPFWNWLPLTAIVVIARLPVPLFVKVAVCGPPELPTTTEPKSSWLGTICNARTTAVVPVPLRPTVLLPDFALLCTCSVALCPPVRCGVNTTCIVQLAPAARLEPHVDDPSEKSLLPVRRGAIFVSVVVPELVTVTACGALATPIATVPKERLAGETSIEADGCAATAVWAPTTDTSRHGRSSPTSRQTTPRGSVRGSLRRVAALAALRRSRGLTTRIANEPNTAVASMTSPSYRAVSARRVISNERPARLRSNRAAAWPW
jgi:hypothetical protein